jgi:uncharacterized protein YggE
MPIVDVVEAYKHFNKGEIEEWRRARIVGYIVARSMGVKVNKPEDLFTLSDDEVTTGITMEEYEIEKQKLRDQGYNI